jgi:hypothetical protein
VLVELPTFKGNTLVMVQVNGADPAVGSQIQKRDPLLSQLGAGALASAKATPEPRPSSTGMARSAMIRFNQTSLVTLPAPPEAPAR